MIIKMSVEEWCCRDEDFDKYMEELGESDVIDAGFLSILDSYLENKVKSASFEQ